MRMLLTPEGALPYEPANLGEVVQFSNDRRSARLAPELPDGPGYPRVEARNNRWCRQNIPGGRWWPIDYDEAREMFGVTPTGEVA